MNKTYNRRTIDGRKFQFLALPGTNLFKFELVNTIGSNIERAVEKATGKNIYGLSHFIEHLGFRAPKDYTTEELMKLLKTEGTYNASTDHDRINYWFKTTSQKMPTAINLVCNYALNDLKNIPADEFETEKKVVYNEAKRYADDDQTMFYFNTVPALCGYHVEDNVLGIPETIDKFTLQDAIETKALFLKHGKMVINITYDPNVLNEHFIADEVNKELDRFEIPVDMMNKIPFPIELHDTMLAYPTVENVLLENASEQAMTSVCLDVIDNSGQVGPTNIVVARLVNNYLSRWADTSLTDIIREQHGLTYGVNFYDSNISFKPYTFFGCDVTRGDEELLMKLFKESINRTVNNFDKHLYYSLMEVQELKRTMRYVNLENFESLHWTALWYPNIIEKYADEFRHSIDEAFTLFDKNEYTYDNIVQYLKCVQDVVNNEYYSVVSNV